MTGAADASVQAIAAVAIAAGLLGCATAVTLEMTSPAAVYRREQAQQAKMDRTTAEKRAEDSVIANARYEQGCTMTVTQTLKPDGGSIFGVVSLSEYIVFTDAATGKALLRGTPVCDDNGTTAEIGDGGRIDMDTIMQASDMSLVTARYQASIGWAQDSRYSTNNALPVPE